MKKFLSIFVSILLIASFFTFPASAAGTIIAFSANTITIGDKVTVTVTVDPGVAMYAVGYKLVYDAEKLSYPNSAGAITVVESPTGETKFTQQFTFTSLAVGSAVIKVEECGYSGADLVDKTLTGASATLTIKDVALSANANLSSLTLSTGNLSPNFTAARTNYTVSVPYETDKITLYAKASDAKAKGVAISSNPTTLAVGANTIKVTVTAQNGSQKIYTVVVTRREQGAIDTPPPVTTPDNPYETVISGKSYEIVTTIPEVSYLKGFTLSSADWNGTQVPVLRDEDNVYTVYYLREAGTTDIAPYTYNAELETFETLKHIVLNNSLYIFADFPEGVTMPDEYYSSYTQIGDYSVSVYQDSDTQMSDFAYAYCFVNGDFGLYRYDSKEGTIQRYPDIHLVDAPAADAPARDNFATRFASLSTNGKVLIIAMLVVAICAIVLISFIIIRAFQKLFGREKAVYENDNNLNFDDVTIVGENDISSSSK